MTTPPQSPPEPLPWLSDVLPPGRAAAESAVNRVFDSVESEPGAPEETARIREWLLTLLDAEYAAIEAEPAAPPGAP